MPPSRVALLLSLLLVTSPLLLAGELHRVAAPKPGPLPHISSPTSVALGDGRGVAVWRVGSGSIWGVTLDAEGLPTAPARRIFDGSAIEGPQVRHVNGSFFLWWRTGFPRITHIVRLDEDLTIVTTKTLNTNAGPLASNESLILAVGNGYALHFLDHELEPVRTEVVAGADLFFSIQAIVLQDGSFAVLATGWNGIFLARFTSGGAPAGPPILLEPGSATSSTSYRPVRAALATDGESILVVWVAEAYGLMPMLMAVIVERDDSLSARRMLVNDRWTSLPGVSAAWSDGMYTIAIIAGQWEGRNSDDLDLYAVRMSESAEVIGDFVPVLVREGLEWNVRMAVSGGKLLLFFDAASAVMREPFMISLPASGALHRADPAAVDARLSESSAWQSWASGASDGNGWLVVWREQTAVSDEIRTVPLGSDGAAAGSPSTLVSVPRYIGFPNVVFNGIDYVVAWVQGSSVLVKRIRRDGVVLDEIPIVVATNATGYVVLAAKAGNSLLAWNAGGVISAAVLYADGRVSAPYTLSPEERVDGNELIYYFQPVAAAGNGSFLVAWTELRTVNCGFPMCSQTSSGQARLVSRDGAPLSTFLTLELTTPTSAAAAGGTYLITDAESARAIVVDAASRSVSSAVALYSGANGGRAFAGADEYLVVFHARDRSGPLVQRLSPAGASRSVESIDAVALPAAINAAGSLLVLRSMTIPENPYHGASGLLAQVIDTFTPLPPSVRRRAVGR
jgi:hypothetical protein